MEEDEDEGPDETGHSTGPNVADEISSEQIRALFQRFDHDGSGKASIEELLAYADKMRVVIAKKDVGAGLTELDGNDDGMLNKEEALREAEEWVKSAETDKERQDALHHRDYESEKFDAVDVNKDGVLDSDELHAMLFPDSSAAAREVGAKYQIKGKDTDADGKISLKEWLLPGEHIEGHDENEDRKEFKMYDKNGDGALDHGELMDLEAGHVALKENLEHFIKLADTDHDGHASVDEVERVRNVALTHPVGHTILDWIEHEEL